MSLKKMSNEAKDAFKEWDAMQNDIILNDLSTK